MDKLWLAVRIGDKEYDLRMQQTAGAWECAVDGRRIAIDPVLVRRDVLSLRIDGQVYEVRREKSGEQTYLWVGQNRYPVELRDPRSLRGRQRGAADDQSPKKLLAPMPGKVIRILAKEQVEVESGQGILVMEAMKMQNEIKSPRKGTVQKILAAEGSAVNAGDVLAIVE